MISEKELYELLLTLSKPVAYDHFDKNIAPPFILFRNTESTSIFADDKTYKRFNEYIVDLVVDKRDLVLETSLETLFDSNNLPYKKYENFIDTEKIYQIRYFIS